MMSIFLLVVSVGIFIFCFRFFWALADEGSANLAIIYLIMACAYLAVSVIQFAYYFL